MQAAWFSPRSWAETGLARARPSGSPAQALPQPTRSSSKNEQGGAETARPRAQGRLELGRQPSADVCWNSKHPTPQPSASWVQNRPADARRAARPLKIELVSHRGKTCWADPKLATAPMERWNSPGA